MDKHTPLVTGLYINHRHRLKININFNIPQYLVTGYLLIMDMSYWSDAHYFKTLGIPLLSQAHIFIK